MKRLLSWCLVGVLSLGVGVTRSLAQDAATDGEEGRRGDQGRRQENRRGDEEGAKKAGEVTKRARTRLPS